VPDNARHTVSFRCKHDTATRRTTQGLIDTAAFPYSAAVAAALARDSAGCSGREVSKLLLAVQAAAYGSAHCAVTPELWQRTVAWKLREYADKRSGAFSSTSTTTSSSSTSSSSTGGKGVKGTSSSVNSGNATTTDKQQPQQKHIDSSNARRSNNSSSSSSSRSDAQTVADAHRASTTTTAETLAASCVKAHTSSDSITGKRSAPFCTSSSSGDDSSSSDQQPELTLAHAVAVQPVVAAVVRSNSSSHDSTPEKTFRKGLKTRSIS
jgi:hypothetical protein